MSFKSSKYGARLLLFALILQCLFQKSASLRQLSIDPVSLAFPVKLISQNRLQRVSGFLNVPNLNIGVSKYHSQQKPLQSQRCEDFSDFLLTGKRWGGPILGPILRFVNMWTVGILFSIILRLFNRIKTKRVEILTSLIFKREQGRGLLTVSNHQSVMDDPGLFAAFLPWWRFTIDKFRWVACTEDVFFANKYLSMILGAGNTLPLDRSGSLEQPLFQRLFDKLNAGKWCHIFPEGRVWQDWRFEGSEPVLGPFKAGVGKLVAHANITPLVVPFYHRGMGDIAPERPLENRKSKKPVQVASIYPNTGKTVTVLVGEPIDFSEKVNKFKSDYPGVLGSFQTTSFEAIELYTDIADTIRRAVLKLENEYAESKESITGTNAVEIHRPTQIA